MGYVLNLIINGLPSIPCYYNGKYSERIQSFKPYYKWITFNTLSSKLSLWSDVCAVLNLIINGLPSIP